MNREIRRLMEFLKHSEKRITKVRPRAVCVYGTPCMGKLGPLFAKRVLVNLSYRADDNRVRIRARTLTAFWKGGESMNSFMAWVGGKKALRDEKSSPAFHWIIRGISRCSAAPDGYCSGNLPVIDFEVFNDLDGNLVNLYRCIA